MAWKILINGFDTKEQALEFIQWYSEQGEQDIEIWIQDHTDLKYLNSPGKATFVGNNTIEMEVNPVYKHRADQGEVLG